MVFDRRDFIKTVGAGTFVGLSGCTGGGGESYPSRPIRSIVIFGAGGGLDRYTRQFTQTISDQDILDISFEVEIITGGNGLSGLSEVNNAEPNGYTLGATAPPIPNISAVKNQPAFDLLDMTPVCQVGEIPGLLITHQDYGVSDFGEMIERYKSGEFSNVGTGWGTMGQVLFNLLSEQGLEFDDMVNYSGAGPAGKAILSKEVPLALASDAGLASAVEGEGQALAVLSPSGSRVFPEIPPITELGFSELPFSGVAIGYRFPPDTSSDRVDTIASAFEQASQTDELQQWSEENGLKVSYKGPEETAEFMTGLDEAIAENSDLITG